MIAQLRAHFCIKWDDRYATYIRVQTTQLFKHTMCFVHESSGNQTNFSLFFFSPIAVLLGCFGNLCYLSLFNQKYFTSIYVRSIAFEIEEKNWFERNKRGFEKYELLKQKFWKIIEPSFKECMRGSAMGGNYSSFREQRLSWK